MVRNVFCCERLKKFGPKDGMTAGYSISNLSRGRMSNPSWPVQNIFSLLLENPSSDSQFCKAAPLSTCFSKRPLEPAPASRLPPRRLGADVLSITASGSSVSKGESLVDTLNTLGAMRPDAIVMRHSASGAPHFLSRYLPMPIVNAGDGTHEHPTQALLDATDYPRSPQTLEHLRVAIIGDIAHSRVARSNVLPPLKIRRADCPLWPCHSAA